MDQRPVSAPSTKKPPSWKLGNGHDKRAQGVVVSGFGSLPTGRALFLKFAWADDKAEKGGEWLRALEAVAPVTDADGADPRATALSFSWTGLKKMGLGRSTLESFDAPFREGMMQEDRLRRIGDRRDGQWLGTVFPGGPEWSANTPQRGALKTVETGQSAALTSTGHKEEQIETPITVHALLQLFVATEEEADSWCKQVADAIQPHQVEVVRTLPLQLRPDANGIAREHFGFADGVSQPIPYDGDNPDSGKLSGPAVVWNDGSEVQKDHWNGVPLGEVLLGHVNGNHEVAPGPILPYTPAAEALGLAKHPLSEGFLDFGLDGSYMVVRELKQDVVAFWESMRAAAKSIRTRDPEHSEHVTTTWLAERVVGRTTKGDLLCPSAQGHLDPDEYNQPQNNFGFFDTDRYGMGCPLGSHVRRANPRDSLAPNEGQKQTLLNAANNHRILRRGRKYGTTISVPPKEDGVDRGLLFICLNTDIGRQFEFVQQTWLLNKNFSTLYDETDPLIGPKGTMTVRDQPLRRILEVDTFVQMRGGDYFFLPSMPALKYLASL